MNGKWSRRAIAEHRSPLLRRPSTYCSNPPRVVSTPTVRHRISDRLEAMILRSENDRGWGRCRCLRTPTRPCGREEPRTLVTCSTKTTKLGVKLDERAAAKQAEQAAKSAERLARGRGLPTAREPGGPIRDGLTRRVAKRADHDTELAHGLRRRRAPPGRT